MPNTAGLDADFRIQAGKYFADYPELVRKIDRKMKPADILAIVKEYNDRALKGKKT